MTKPNWIEQEYAEIAAEIPDVVAGIRHVVAERIARHAAHPEEAAAVSKGHKGAARWQTAAELLETEHERIRNRFTPRPTPN